MSNNINNASQHIRQVGASFVIVKTKKVANIIIDLVSANKTPIYNLESVVTNC
jgi:hypothetical protein